jgi:hypothetical protein
MKCTFQQLFMSTYLTGRIDRACTQPSRNLGDFGSSKLAAKENHRQGMTQLVRNMSWCQMKKLGDSNSTKIPLSPLCNRIVSLLLSLI